MISMYYYLGTSFFYTDSGCHEIVTSNFSISMTGLQYGYINDVFGLIRNDDECVTRFGFPVVKFDLVKTEPKIWFDPSTTNRIRYSIT